MAGARRRVLITRPQPAASHTAQRLAKLGFEPITLPLQEMLPVPVAPLAIPVEGAAVAVTSANAVRHASRDILDRLCGLPSFGVGAATAACMREAGFTRVLEGGGDAEMLADRIIASRPPGPIVYLCGRIRRPAFENRLSSAGFTVAAFETYDTAPVVRSREQILDAVGGGPIDQVLIYSAFAAAEMVRLMARPELRDSFEHAELLCISARTAGVLAGGGHRGTRVASEPTEAALLSLLEGAP
ncbi:uroporphyrinogen-III synthase [Mesorhizobium sp. ZMM04-5]|uniref:Uroporphyrinogen-III synthase n=1 Tax=Mesorhizobium marinum TaxID=3228790 RepID=A0ABV3QY47_9HYPH